MKSIGWVAGMLHSGALICFAILTGGARGLCMPTVWLTILVMVLASIAESSRLPSMPRFRPTRDRLAVAAAAGTGLALLAEVLIAIATAAMVQQWPSGWTWLVIAAGVLIAVVGIALRVISIGQLGEAFVTDIVPPVTGQWIATGLYRWMRHPSEWGLALIAVAVPLIAFSLLAILPALLMLTFVAFRMRRETRMLCKPLH